ncbi:MAG TPA: TolC family protein [Verrucomicrobiae bacterium]|nr:TolC family protein [Verrucomicrobiae bacterium]
MKPVVILSVFAAVALALGGCRGISTAGERQERHDFATVADNYRPKNAPPALPGLTAPSSLSNFVEYALLNSPTVEAAFDDWSASVENITVTRSMPDPKLTFQAYIQSALTSLMPGLMQDIPGPGKLKTAARVAAADSQAKYFAFESSVLQAAFDVKSAYYNLYFLDEQIRIDRQTLTLLADLDRAARAQNEVGRGTLQDVYRAQIDEDQLTTDITNLADSRQPLYARFKAALGLTRDQQDPPLPTRFESTPLDLNANDLLNTAFARNPQLKSMETEVRSAEASIAQARKSNLPDFSASLQAEVYHPPFYWPQASITLPIWRDKVAAEIAAAQAGKRAAQARLTAEQIDLTVSVASGTFDYRESTRNLTLLENHLIPTAHQSLDVARAGYLSGQIDFSSLIDAERSWLNFQLQAVQERARREIILASLSLLIAGVPPPGAPVLAMPPEASNASHPK